MNTYESTFFFLVRDTSPTHSLNISQTQQQVVFTVLAGWAVVLSVAKATFGGGKKEEKVKLLLRIPLHSRSNCND